MPSIGINRSTLNELVAGLRQAGESFEEQKLDPLDEMSTISANTNSATAFQETQSAHHALSVALVQSSQEIQGIGDRFFEMDEQVAANWESN